MKKRSIKVKIINESSNRITIRFMSLNRKMPISREVFEARVDDGTYEVVS